MNQTDTAPLLEARGVTAEIDGKQILKGVDLTVRPGEVHAIMGRNGSGKSTFSHVVMGNPKYAMTGGELLFEGRPLAGLGVDERARRGIFLSFQYPMAIPGVTVANFLRAATRAVHGESLGVKEFRRLVQQNMELLGVDSSFAARYVNDGFSGGEKKRLEILQMALLRPKLAILDETDSGLDIDALRVVAEGIERMRAPERGLLLITHYQRILRYVAPDVIHVMIDGRIVRTGGPELADELEERGYDWLDDAAKEA
ncbi:MAG TPA: Fe-S cluster assembly ATPase SufC [Acidobacteriota bacterium]|nr:Fe-S cluster assembly ATPase SufC [Acidobacteriota bacterium]